VSIFSLLCANVCKYTPTFITRLVSVGKKSLEVEEKPDLVFHATLIDLFPFTPALNVEKTVRLQRSAPAYVVSPR